MSATASPPFAGTFQMSPRMENAIQRPSGLHAGSIGPVVTGGRRWRSTRSDCPYRLGSAMRRDVEATRSARAKPIFQRAGFMVRIRPSRSSTKAGARARGQTTRGRAARKVERHPWSVAVHEGVTAGFREVGIRSWPNRRSSPSYPSLPLRDPSGRQPIRRRDRCRPLAVPSAPTPLRSSPARASDARTSPGDPGRLRALQRGRDPDLGPRGQRGGRAALDRLDRSLLVPEVGGGRGPVRARRRDDGSARREPFDHDRLASALRGRAR